MSNPYQQFDEMYGSAFGVNPAVLSEIGRLESNHNPKAINDWDSNARRGTPSQGRMQFIRPTFSGFLRQAQQARPGVFNQWSEKDFTDPEAQTALTAWAIRNGKGGHWATFGRAKQAAGGNVFQKKNWGALKGGHHPGDGHDHGGEGQSVSLGHWQGGPDTKKLRKIQNAWQKHPEMGKALMDQHVRHNKPEWVPGKVTGTPKAIGPGAGWTPSGSYRERMNDFIKRFGIRFDSGASWGHNPQQGGGSHTAGSLHYAGRAFDIGDAANSRQTINNVANYVKSNPGMFQEFFYDPLGWYVKGGKVHQGAIGGHGNHAHIGFM